MVWWLAAVAMARPGCGTPVLHQPSAVTPFSASFRPDSVGFVDSDLYPLRVHYRRAADAGKAQNVVLPALEASWRVLVDEVGWPAPVGDFGRGGNDAYDVYVTNDGTFGGGWVWGWGPDVVPDDDYYSVPSYMVLDEDLPDEQMLSWAAHELTHALQYTVDAWEFSDFVWESTAETYEDLVDDDSHLYVHFGTIPDFQAHPFLSLVFDGSRPQVQKVDPWSWYEYGGVVFGMFVEERYGNADGRTLLAVWEGLAQGDASSQPDFLDGLESLDDDTSLAQLYTEFALWRMFTGVLDDGAHFDEAHLWGDDARVGVEGAWLLEEVDGLVVSPVERPYDLGTTYYVVSLDGDDEGELHLEMTGGEGARWGLVWAVWYDEGPALTSTLTGGGGETLRATVPLEEGQRVQIGVVNAGPEGMRATFDVPRRSFQLAMEVEAPPEPPTDTVTTTEPTVQGTRDTLPAGPEGFAPGRPSTHDAGRQGASCRVATPGAWAWWLPLLPLLRRSGGRCGGPSARSRRG